MTSNKALVDEINDRIKANEFSAAELSAALSVSTTSVSLWRNNKYARDVSTLETKIRRFLRSRSLSAHDEKILVSLLRLLDESEDRTALIGYLVRECEHDIPETSLPEMQGTEQAARSSNFEHEHGHSQNATV